MRSWTSRRSRRGGSGSGRRSRRPPASTCRTTTSSSSSCSSCSTTAPPPTPPPPPSPSAAASAAEDGALPLPRSTPRSALQNRFSIEDSPSAIVRLSRMWQAVLSLGDCSPIRCHRRTVRAGYGPASLVRKISLGTANGCVSCRQRVPPRVRLSRRHCYPARIPSPSCFIHHSSSAC